MVWQGVFGHDRVVEQFRRALSRGRLASTFLFVGPPGIGKKAFALKMAQGLLCDEVPPEKLEPCGGCPACVQVMAGTHPDVEVIARPADKAFIPLDLLIGDDEHRMRAGLCYNVSLKPYSGKRRIAIIDDADYLNREGANCLLKTLEEPPPGAVLILLGTSEQRQLPTIRSRCQVIRFRPLPTGDVQRILLQQQLVETSEVAEQAASKSEGSVQRALAAVDATLTEFAGDFLDQISKREFDVPALAKSIITFIDSAGKESAAKRARLKQAIGCATDFYRRLMTATVAPLPTGKDVVDRTVSQAMRWWPGGEEAAAACIDACLDAVAAVDANANQATLLECWLDELGTVARTGQPVMR